jgi:hypothetical protein
MREQCSSTEAVNHVHDRCLSGHGVANADAGRKERDGELEQVGGEGCCDKRYILYCAWVLNKREKTIAEAVGGGGIRHAWRQENRRNVGEGKRRGWRVPGGKWGEGDAVRGCCR